MIKGWVSLSEVNRSVPPYRETWWLDIFMGDDKLVILISFKHNEWCEWSKYLMLLCDGYIVSCVSSYFIYFFLFLFSLWTAPCEQWISVQFVECLQHRLVARSREIFKLATTQVLQPSRLLFCLSVLPKQTVELKLPVLSLNQLKGSCDLQMRNGKTDFLVPALWTVLPEDKNLFWKLWISHYNSVIFFILADIYFDYWSLYCSRNVYKMF